MDLGLKNKIAFVAGSSKGLGFAAALRLAKEGCRVALNGRDAQRVQSAAQALAKESGAEVIALIGNVAQPEVPAALIKQTVAAFGGLDILITNSGGPAPGSIDALDESAWQAGVDLCFAAHVRLIKAALPHLRKSNAASILTVTSFSARQPIPNLLVSNSLRGATLGLTKSLALELGPQGIRVNSILPGWTATERVAELMNARAQQNATSAEEEAQRLSTEIPLRRLGNPEEFGNVAAFLVSPAASYITGVMLGVDGGAVQGLP